MGHFVYRIKDSKIELLLLKPNPEPNLSYDYYVITGGVEKQETFMQAAIRETAEEIGIRPSKVIELEETITYINHSNNMEILEKCFASQIDHSDLVLNEEHIGYKWVSIEDFIDMIWWKGSKDKL